MPSTPIYAFSQGRIAKEKDRLRSTTLRRMRQCIFSFFVLPLFEGYIPSQSHTEKKLSPLLLRKAVQGNLEGGDEIVAVLHAAADTHEAVGDADLHAVLARHVGVGHDGRAGDDALRGSR